MFRGGFVEAIKGAALFPDDHPYHFKFLVEWCYTQKFPPITDLHGRDCEARKSTYYRMLGLYCFAEKYNILRLMDYCIDSVMACQPEGLTYNKSLMYTTLKTLPRCVYFYPGPASTGW